MTLKNDDIIRLLFICVAIFFLLLLTPIVDISAEKLTFVLLGFVSTVGLSHGSLDWLLARHWGIRRNFTESLIFLVVYAVIVLMTLAIWWWVPTFGLVIFLIMSMVHFASDWKDELTRPVNLVMGIAVVALPGVMFEKEVLMLFSLLVPVHKAAMLSQYTHDIGCIAMIGASLIAWQQIKISPLLTAEIVGLLAIGTLLPPIVYFSIYFCVLHSTKHWLQMKKIGLYHHFSQALWSAVWPTAICIMVGICVWHLSSSLSLSQALIRMVFMGLAALTVPHWLLLEVYPLALKPNATG